MSTNVSTDLCKVIPSVALTAWSVYNCCYLLSLVITFPLACNSALRGVVYVA